MTAGGGVTGWDILGALGTATGVPALAWEIVRWRREGPRISVEAANAFPVYQGSMGGHHFQVTAVNKGRAEGNVAAWGLRLPDGSNLVDTAPLPWSDRPGPIPANGGRLSFYIPAPGVIDACRQRGFAVGELTAWVRLGTGKVVNGPNVPYTG